LEVEEVPADLLIGQVPKVVQEEEAAEAAEGLDSVRPIVFLLLLRLQVFLLLEVHVFAFQW
jgi:hypothetical protein